MYKIITIDKPKSNTKITLLYDDIWQKVNEKWISYPLKKDDSKHLITVRTSYVYNDRGVISDIVKIEFGSVGMLYQNDNEYVEIRKRKNVSNDSHWSGGTKVIKYFNSEDKCYKTIWIDVIDKFKGTCLIRINKINNLNTVTNYVYCDENPEKLMHIVRHNNELGFLKFDKKKEKINNSNILKVAITKQDYIHSYYAHEDVYIHELLITEDENISLKNDLLKMFYEKIFIDKTYVWSR